MSEMNYSLSDIKAAVGNDNNGYCCNPCMSGWGNYGGFGGFGGFMNNDIWLLLILFLTGGNGFGFGNRGGAPVTEADLCSANSFNDLKAGVRDVSGQISSMNVGFTKGLCDFGYEVAQQFMAMERQMSNCCCEQLRAIDSVNYNIGQQAGQIKFDMANYFANMGQAICNSTQSIKDMIRDYQEQNMRDANMKSYIDSSLCGVMRWPQGATYPAQWPYGNGCGCNGCGNV